MEILLLVCLYYLSQNPNFTQSVKPLMEQLKNSEQTLRFLNDLAKFNETFQTHKSDTPCPDEKKQENKHENKQEKTCDTTSENKTTASSPTVGIADDFIQKILDGYLNKQK